MSLGSRLHKAMRGKGITQKDLGKLLGVKSGTISYRIRNNAFKSHDIDFICNHFGINPEWVKLGVGEIYQDSETTYASKEIESDIQERSVEYYNILTGNELNEIINNEKDYSRKVLIERIRDLEIKLLQALDAEKIAVKRERQITDRYLELLEQKNSKD
ncbi:helix-turn-helix domain-containing protein [Parvicella tangerina]|uniref:HTH cro/C1-type domain-containing protein n=1 Tax=Parvicella tangerina TaxID=2829795 RepID=A0A916NBI9_9FLAO|nr:helix-turn-helix transcriptional regulator [Parvicella tangerina]CAG5083278.1 hypothetical protein CRYO30217_02147 [Parvicella tangerina]